MNILRVGILVALCSVAAVQAQAMVNPFGRVQTGLNDEDRRLLRTELRRILETGQVGSVGGWLNAKSATFGTMEIRRVFRQSGLGCKQVLHVIKLRKERDARRFLVSYCKAGDGQWKILS